MMDGWRRVDSNVALPTGYEQGVWLGEFIQRQWDELDHPCSRQVTRRALDFVDNRLARFDLSGAVLIHGDAHPANVLHDLGGTAPTGFKMIDPEGIVSEPAHDLAIPLRGWTDELMAGHAPQLILQWCHQLAAATGVDPVPIWKWAFIERVSTGLLLSRLGDPRGCDFLDLAGLLAPLRP